MNNCKLRCFLAILWGVVTNVGYAGIIATYTFPGADTGGDATAPAAANATFSPFSRTNVTAVSLNDQFASTSYTSAAAIDLGEYVEFTVTANAGYKLDLESLSFKHTRNDQNSNRTGPQNGAVRASFESFAAGSGTGSTFLPITSQASSTWDFVDFSTIVGGSATFRFYGWNSIGTASNNMQLRLDDVVLNGNVTLVPPPGTPPTVNDVTVPGVNASDPGSVMHQFTATDVETPAGPFTWDQFQFVSYTPNYGAPNTPAKIAQGNAEAVNATAPGGAYNWNTVGAPRGDYVWSIRGSDPGSLNDTGTITVNVVEVPEPATTSLFGLAIIGLLKTYRRR